MKILSRLACLMACVLSFSGCTYTIDRSYKQSDFPPVGNVQAAELGTQLLIQRNAMIVNGRKVTKETKINSDIYFGIYVPVNKGEKYCSSENSSEKVERGDMPRNCITEQFFREKNIPFVECEVVSFSKENFQKILEYTGKSANTISLYYKEYNDTFIRPAFTQEFKFDLSESKIIGIKGARIEVIEANNTGITYKVITHFPR